MRSTLFITLLVIGLGVTAGVTSGHTASIGTASDKLFAKADSVPAIEIVNNLMRKSIFPMFERHIPSPGFELSRMSRCTSGYGFVMNLKQADKNLEFGVAQLSIGCGTRNLAEFKIDLALGVVYLHDEGATEWLSLHDYELRKFGKAS
jgi:hypothetical protein